ncbi:fused MFS/spermidine synthase [Lysobacter niabensis]|uniref:fused MFS/spermidine synthase n=1 Tax=Agrilutibacter niabensis TaxID=380628 RepID=UPI00360C9992
METTPTGWRAWLASLIAGWRTAKAPPHLRKPFIRRRTTTIELQFVRGTSQSQMLTREPDRLLIDYTRTMLGALVLAPRPRSIGIVGLGGGSQAKYCYRHLPGARIEVVENNPHVLALRRRFHIPDDDARFQVFLDDGARFLQVRRGRYDLLLVDAYDETGIPAALSTQAFYDDCRASLAEGGAMAINLYGADCDAHLERLQQAFGTERVMELREPRQSNSVVLAWAGARAADDEAMTLSAEARDDLASVFAGVRDALATR